MTTTSTETKGRQRQARIPGMLAAMLLLTGLMPASSVVLAEDGRRQATSTRVSSAKTDAKASYHAKTRHRSRHYGHYRSHRHHYFRLGYPFYSYYGPYYGRYYHYSGYGPYVHRRGEYAASGSMGALDLDVRPEKAEVFLDGKRLGVADNFDGFPEFLWLKEGTYDLVIYKEGYKTLARQVTIYPGVVIDIEDRMEAGQAVRPEDLKSKETVNRDERHRRNRERAAVAESRRGTAKSVGRLQLEVEPEDAAVYLDGHFLGIAGELAGLSAGLVIEPGEHELEIVRPGYATHRRLVEIAEDETAELEVELEER